MITFVMIEDYGDDVPSLHAPISTEGKDANTKRLHGHSRKGVGDDDDDDEDANKNAIYVKRLQ